MAFEPLRLKAIGGQDNEDFGGDVFSYTPSAASGDTLASIGVANFFLLAEQSLNVDDIIKVIADGQEDFRVLTSTENGVTIGGVAGVQSLSVATGVGVISLGDEVTELTTTGVGTSTLANGVPGQRKTIVMIVDGGNNVLTPALFANGTTITFGDANDLIELLWATTIGWTLVANEGTVIA